MVATTTTTSSSVPLAYFCHSNPADPICVPGVFLRRTEYEFWLHNLPALEADSDTEVMKLSVKTAKAGRQVTDAAIIDAYQHAYNIAHTHGGAGRSHEMPPMRDRQTMARQYAGTSLSPRASPTAVLARQEKLPAANAKH